MIKQADMFGAVEIPKWQYDQLHDDFVRAESRMERLQAEYTILKAKYIALMEHLERGSE